MFGLDERIAGASHGATLAIVIAVAVVLGLRHATDPDHLAAVTTLIGSKKERTARLAGRLGFSWGLGHATSLFAFGLPIVLYRAYLPAAILEGAEVLVGFVIVALAAWLLIRWRRGIFHLHDHEHERGNHAHLHSHVATSRHAHRHTIRTRSPLQAYGIGLVHGMGGSAGVGVLLLGSIHSGRMRLEERFTRLDHDNLEFSLTLTDPKAYVGVWGGKKLKLKLLNSSQQIQKGLWGKRTDGTAYGDMREEYCVYSIERTFWQGRPLEGIGGDKK